MTLNSAASLLFVWFGTHLEVEHKPSPLVESFVGADDQLEVEQIVRVGKFRGTGFRQIQLVNICFQFLEIDRQKVERESIPIDGVRLCVCLPLVILSWAAVKAFFWGPPDFGVASPSFFCCFSEKSLIILAFWFGVVVD